MTASKYLEKKTIYSLIVLLLIILGTGLLVLRPGPEKGFVYPNIDVQIPEKVLNHTKPLSFMDVAVDEEGNIYVVDEEGKRVMVFDEDGNYIENILRTPIIDTPYRVDLDGDDIYILDRAKYHVFKIDIETRNLESYKIPTYSRAFAVGKNRIFVGDDTNKDRVYVFDKDFNRVGTMGPFDGERALSNIQGIDVGPEGMIYIADEGNQRIQIFNPDLEFVDEIRSAGGIDFSAPRGVTVDKDGILHVVDKNNKNLVVINKDGELLHQIENLEGPFHSTVEKGKTYICDEGSKNLWVYDEEYKLVGEIEGSTIDDVISFFDPRSLVLDSSGNIFIGDDQNTKVIKLDADFNLINEIGSHGDGKYEFNRPRMLAVDSEDNIYVTDRYNGRIQVYNNDLEYVSTIQYDMNEPRGIAIGKDDKIYVADTLNNRVLIFNSDHQFSGAISGTEEGNNFLKQPRALRYHEEKLFVLCPPSKTVKIFNQELEMIDSIDLSDFLDVPRGFDIFGGKLYINDFANMDHLLTYDLDSMEIEERKLPDDVVLKKPRELFIDNSGRIFICNEGSNSVLVLDQDMGLVKEIKGNEAGQGDIEYMR